MGKERDRGWRASDGFFRANKPPSGSFGMPPEIRRTGDIGSSFIVNPRSSHAPGRKSLEAPKTSRRKITVFSAHASLLSLKKLNVVSYSATSAEGKLLAPPPKLEAEFQAGKILYLHYERLYLKELRRRWELHKGLFLSILDRGSLLLTCNCGNEPQCHCNIVKNKVLRRIAKEYGYLFIDGDSAK